MKESNKAATKKAANKTAKQAADKPENTAADNVAASVVQVSCTVVKHGAKIRNMICATGKSIKLPSDEADVLAKHGLIKIG